MEEDGADSRRPIARFIMDQPLDAHTSCTYTLLSVDNNETIKRLDLITSVFAQSLSRSRQGPYWDLGLPMEKVETQHGAFEKNHFSHELLQTCGGSIIYGYNLSSLNLLVLKVPKT